MGIAGGELGDHGGEALDGAEPDEGNLQGEVDVGQAVGGLENSRAEGSGVAHQAHEDLCLSRVSDDIGSAAAVDETNVEGGWPDVVGDGQLDGEQAGQDLDQLMDGASPSSG